MQEAEQSQPTTGTARISVWQRDTGSWFDSCCAERTLSHWRLADNGRVEAAAVRAASLALADAVVSGHIHGVRQRAVWRRMCFQGPGKAVLAGEAHWELGTIEAPWPIL